MRERLALLFLAVCCWSVYGQTACSVPGSVRLVGLEVAAAGRVELCQGGEWGTVCSTSRQWGLKNAQVVCRSLGYTTAVTAIPQDSVVSSLRAGDAVNIYLTGVECDGTEPNLLSCSHSNDDVISCSHFNDVAVVCAAVDSAGNGTPGDVRLLGDTTDYRGAVEYYDAILGWTGVCADSTHSSTWTSSRAAEIVCTQLGFEGGRAFSQSAEFLEDVVVAVKECSDSAFSLSDCQTETLLFSGGCASQQAGWVECRQTEREDFSVRLVPGGREGLVEVVINGRWGTVCGDNLWLQPNAEVVCNQLGLESESTPSVTPSTSHVGYMSRLKPFWLSSVNCLVGVDQSLSECNRNLIIGYSSQCSLAPPTTIFNSAEVNCGPPVPHRLSGGAVAGIVLAVLAFVAALVLGFIYLPERWKRRQSYSWYRKLTTPSRWCEWMGVWCRGHAPRRRVRHHHNNQATTVTTSTNENREYPPATNTSSPAREEPPATDEPTETEVGGQGSEGNLTLAAPPPYQAAVSYPVASGPSQPPAYSEKPVLPPNLPGGGWSLPPNLPGGPVLPYPTANTDPAYPPPLPGQNPS